MTMYVLDSNVFSEITNPQPNPQVKAKYLEHVNEIYVATTVWHELNYGLNIMPIGKKRKIVEMFLYAEVANFPILAYNKQSATIHAQIRANCRKKGKTLAFADSQIASIAMANNAVLVTRNVSDFEGIKGLNVVDWFK